jgi:hypothetical protein
LPDLICELITVSVPSFLPSGEVEIEDMIKQIEEEEKKRQEVKEVQVPPPLHRYF